jgi:hypothetical protein
MVVAEFLGAAADRWQIVLVIVEQEGSLVLMVEPTRSAVACPGDCGTTRAVHSRRAGRRQHRGLNGNVATRACPAGRSNPPKLASDGPHLVPCQRSRRRGGGLCGRACSR